MTEPDTARLIYIGRRWQTSKSAPGYAWAPVDKPDTTLLFAKVVGGAVGSIYDVRVGRDASGRISSAYHDPKYTGEQWVDTDQVVSWQAIDQQVRREDRMRKAENRAAKSEELDRALDPIRNVLHGVKNYDDAEAILNIMRTKLWREWTGRKL